MKLSALCTQSKTERHVYHVTIDTPTPVIPPHLQTVSLLLTEADFTKDTLTDLTIDALITIKYTVPNTIVEIPVTLATERFTTPAALLRLIMVSLECDLALFPSILPTHNNAHNDHDDYFDYLHTLAVQWLTLPNIQQHLFPLNDALMDAFSQPLQSDATQPLTPSHYCQEGLWPYFNAMRNLSRQNWERRLYTMAHTLLKTLNIDVKQHTDAAIYTLNSLYQQNNRP